MSGGDIVVHGDVGGDPGAGMTGGRIIINGRCPTPPPGVILRTLNKTEVKEINKLLSDEKCTYQQMLFVAPDGDVLEGIMAECREDLSGISLIPMTTSHNPSYSTCDTVVLLGQEDSLALPIPLLPFVPQGVQMTISSMLSQRKSKRL